MGWEGRAGFSLCCEIVGSLWPPEPGTHSWLDGPTGCGGGNGRPADTATGGGTRGKAVDPGSTLNPGSRPDTGGQGSLRLLHGCEVGFRGLPMWWDPKTLPPPALGAGPHLPAPVYAVTVLPNLLPGASRATAGWGAASIPESPGVNTARAKEPPAPSVSTRHRREQSLDERSFQSKKGALRSGAWARPQRL